MRPAGPSAREGTGPPSSRHSPRTRRRPSSDHTRPGTGGRPAARSPAPGDGAPPAAELVVTDDGSLTGSLGTPELDAELVAAAQAALKRGLSRTIELGGRSLFIEVFPVRPRLVIVGGVEVARSLVRL